MMNKIFLGIAFITILGCSKTHKSNSVEYTTTQLTEARPFAPGVISTDENSEFEIMFSPDGLTAYFSRRSPGGKQKIYQTSFSDGNWSNPIICNFSIDRDEAPSITPDGNLFFFGSERAIPGKPNKGNFDMNIWKMEKLEDKWTEPQPLPFPINDVQVEGEEWPSSNNNFISTIDNKTFYYSTMRRGEKSIKLFKTEYVNNKFSTPTEIKGIFEDDKYWIYSPFVSPDGKYLVFNSYGAPGGIGGEDIFISKKTENGWGKARSIGSKVNSTDEESAPRFSRDGRYFFFTRAKNLGNYEYGEWDIFYIETKYLDLEKIFE